MASVLKLTVLKLNGSNYKAPKKRASLPHPLTPLARSVRGRGPKTAKIGQTKLFD